MDEPKEAKPNPVHDKSYAFALRVIRLYQYLVNEKQECVLSKFLLNTGTLVGAHVEAAQQSLDRHGFQQDMGIALQKATLTQYWLKLLLASEHLTQAEFDSIFTDADELVSLLTAIVKSAKRVS